MPGILRTGEVVRNLVKSSKDKECQNQSYVYPTPRKIWVWLSPDMNWMEREVEVEIEIELITFSLAFLVYLGGWGDYIHCSGLWPLVKRPNDCSSRTIILLYNAVEIW